MDSKTDILTLTNTLSGVLSGHDLEGILLTACVLKHLEELIPILDGNHLYVLVPLQGLANALPPLLLHISHSTADAKNIISNRGNLCMNAIVCMRSNPTHEHTLALLAICKRLRHVLEWHIRATAYTHQMEVEDKTEHVVDMDDP